MPDIAHRVTIDAPADRVHDLLTTSDGVGQWWSGRPLEGEATAGGHFAIYFGDADRPAAEMDVVSDTADEVTWNVVAGPPEWVGTTVTFALRSDSDRRTTVLFAHRGWREQTEFFSGCSTNWGAYLTSLKHGAETGAFAAFPASEISRWD